MAFEYLANYVTFESVEEMDKQIAERIDRDRFELTKSERAIVFAIKKHCLDYPGACCVRNKVIADEVGVSLITVSRAIKKIIELKIIAKENKPKMNGIKGANIYYFLPQQQNDVSSMMHREEGVEASNDNGSDDVLEDVSIKSFNLLKTSNLNDVYNNAIAEKEAAKEYMNEYQVMLFDFMYSLPLANEFKDELHKLVLAAQVDSVVAFHKAKNVMIRLAQDIADGTLTITRTLRSVFVGAFNKATKRSNSGIVNTSSVEEQPQNECPVPFYDWLNERESGGLVQDVPKPNIDNWLEW